MRQIVDPDSHTRPLFSERELQAAVIELARYLGWRVYHTHDSRRSAPGMVDFFAVRARPGEPARLCLAEFKSDNGVVSFAQRAWLADLHAVAEAAAALGSPRLISVHLWRPTDWFDGTIERILKGA
jgi:hypothetical protein